MHPLSTNQRLHCKLESTEDGYVLKYEHLHHYLPLLQAKRKRGSLIHGGYRIEPAFDCNLFQNSKDLQGLQQWATRLHTRDVAGEQTSTSGGNNSPSRKLSILRRHLRSAFKPGHSQGVMDVHVSPQQKTSYTMSSATTTSPGDSHTVSDDASLRDYANKRPVLAEIEGNSILNRFRFRTGCSLFQDGILGSLNITTNYIKCQPRKLAVYLTGPGRSRSMKGTPSGDDVTVEDTEVHEEETNDISLYSKDPDWNDRYQIYELDFGGRVSTDSIKNFQIERDGRVVSALSRIV